MKEIELGLEGGTEGEGGKEGWGAWEGKERERNSNLPSLGYLMSGKF